MKKFLLLIAIIAAMWQTAVAGQDSDTLWTKRIGFVTCVKFSPDGTKVAAGNQYGNIFIYNTLTGQLLQTFNHANGDGLIDFSPDGEYIASGGGGIDTPDSARIKIWDLENNKLLLNVQDTITPLLKGYKIVGAISFSKDGKYLAAALDLGMSGYQEVALVIWERTSYRIILTVRTKSAIKKLEFSPDNNYLAVAYSYKTDNSVVMLQTKTWSPKMPSLNHPKTIVDFKYSFDGTKLITGCDDGYVRVWNTDNFSIEKVILVPAVEVFSVAMSKENEFITYSWAGIKQGLRRISYKTQETIYDYNSDYFGFGGNDLMRSLVISPINDYLFTGGDAGIYLYYSNLTLVMSNPDEEDIQKLFPNPTTNSITIIFNNPLFQLIKIDLTTLKGNLLNTIFEGSLDIGQKNITYNCTNLPAGTYFILLTSRAFSKTYKLVKEV